MLFLDNEAIKKQKEETVMARVGDVESFGPFIKELEEKTLSGELVWNKTEQGVLKTVLKDKEGDLRTIIIDPRFSTDEPQLVNCGKHCSSQCSAAEVRPIFMLADGQINLDTEENKKSIIQIAKLIGLNSEKGIKKIRKAMIETVYNVYCKK